MKIKYNLQKWLRNQLIRLVSLKSLKINKLHSIPTEIIPTPEALSMNFSAEAKRLKCSEYRTPEIYSTTLNQVYFYAKYNTILDSYRRIIIDSLNVPPKQEKYSLRFIYLTKAEKISGVCTVIRSISNHQNYFHALIDYLPRLYLLDRKEYQNQEIKLLITHPLTELENLFLNKIKLNNIKIVSVSPDKLYEIEKLIFPTFMTVYDSGYLPKAYLGYLLPKIIPKRSRNAKNRIFISRKLITEKRGRYIFNEDELMDLLSKYGFKKYNLEDISIQEQIELFYDAKHIIGSHGAGLSNMIFAKNATILELFPSQVILPHYYYMSKSLNHKYQYQCGKAYSRHSNFEVDIVQVSRYLKQL